MVPELVQALAWSVFGLAFGWYFCHGLKEVDEIREVLVHHSISNGNGNGNGNGTGGVRKVSEVKEVKQSPSSKDTSNRPRRALGIFMMVLAVAVGVNAWYSTKQDREATQRETARSQCQAEFNSDMARVLRIRNGYAEQDRAETLKMWDALLDVKATSATRLKAAQDFRAAMHRTEVMRDAIPLPDLESRNC